VTPAESAEGVLGDARTGSAGFITTYPAIAHIITVDQLCKRFSTGVVTVTTGTAREEVTVMFAERRVEA
jgi:hypothetical protein